MGRTLQSATQTWIEEEKALTRFTRALRKEDQRIMRDLINLSRLHIAEASYAGNLYPMDAYLISMLLESAKRSARLEQKVNELCRQCGVSNIVESDIPELPSLKELLSGSADDSDDEDA